MKAPDQNDAGKAKPLWLTWLVRGLTWPIALIVVFEEWGWEPLQRAMALLAKRLRLEWLSQRIAALPPYPALTLFLLPVLLLLPVKLAALWLLANGHALLGVAVVAAAKLVGTAMAARLFELLKPSLMQLAWFARLYGRWIAWKDGLLAQVRASWPWRAARVLKRQVTRALGLRLGRRQ
ncbi:MAG TPA: hypothetical protein VLJ86_08760 [Ramlibacter sp.]|nr:hypothetical protein [Ramlibacter sp.]